MKIILCGYMASGKTSAGKLLASELGKKFVDLDHEIEKKEGKSIPTIFSEKNEIYFRKQEHIVLQEVLKNENNAVIALGGGTVCYGNNLQLIQDDSASVLIYLKVNLAELQQRLLKEAHTRPLLANLAPDADREEFLRKHLFERQYYYLQSDYTVDTSKQTLNEVVDAIKKQLA